jgi:hypothetical protein
LNHDSITADLNENGTPTECAEKLRVKKEGHEAGTTEYYSFDTEIELQISISVAYNRLEEIIQPLGLIQLPTTAIGMCLWMACALSISPENGGGSWLDLLQGTIHALKQVAPACDIGLAAHITHLIQCLCTKPFDYIAHDEIVTRALSMHLNRDIRVVEENGATWTIDPAVSRNSFGMRAVDTSKGKAITITRITTAGPEHFNGTMPRPISLPPPAGGVSALVEAAGSADDGMGNGPKSLEVKKSTQQVTTGDQLDDGNNEGNNESNDEGEGAGMELCETPEKKLPAAPKKRRFPVDERTELTEEEINANMRDVSALVRLSVLPRDKPRPARSPSPKLLPIAERMALPNTPGLGPELLEMFSWTMRDDPLPFKIRKGHTPSGPVKKKMTQTTTVVDSGGGDVEASQDEGEDEGGMRGIYQGGEEGLSFLVR